MVLTLDVKVLNDHEGGVTPFLGFGKLPTLQNAPYTLTLECSGIELWFSGVQRPQPSAKCTGGGVGSLLLRCLFCSRSGPPGSHLICPRSWVGSEENKNFSLHHTKCNGEIICNPKLKLKAGQECFARCISVAKPF